MAGRLPIFMYHAIVKQPVSEDCFVQESVFRKQVAYLKKVFDIIPLSEALRRLREGQLSHPTAVLTLDDGFQNNYDVAFPILVEADVRATIFLTTGFIGTKRTFWYGNWVRAFWETRHATIRWDGRTLSLQTNENRRKASIVIQEGLKKLPQEQLTKALDRLIRKLGKDPDSPIPRASPVRMLSHFSVKAMASSGLLEIGAHTHSHAILSKLSDRRKREEIEQSLRKIEEWTGQRCKVFAYPNGERGDYDATCIDILREKNVESAVTTIWGINNKRTPILELRRLGISSRWNWRQFEAIVGQVAAQCRAYDQISRQRDSGIRQPNTKRLCAKP